MSEKSEGNNHMSKINVFPVLHTIFFTEGDLDLCGKLHTRKNRRHSALVTQYTIVFPLRGKQFHFMTRLWKKYYLNSKKLFQNTFSTNWS